MRNHDKISPRPLKPSRVRTLDNHQRLFPPRGCVFGEGSRHDLKGIARLLRRLSLLERGRKCHVHFGPRRALAQISRRAHCAWIAIRENSTDARTGQHRHQTCSSQSRLRVPEIAAKIMSSHVFDRMCGMEPIPWLDLFVRGDENSWARRGLTGAEGDAAAARPMRRPTPHDCCRDVDALFDPPRSREVSGTGWRRRQCRGAR